MRKIKVGVVSYLNTKPLIYGFEQGMMKDSVELVPDYPARIAGMLVNDEIDLGLVPVAIIPRLKESHIISDYCIGAEGEVASVCIFGDRPLEEITEVMLDYQSRTSVRLARILLKEYWKVNPRITDAREDFREHIKGATAGLVIGDRAFAQRLVSPYHYDLGEAWKQHTGLPFVFAAWIANKKLDPAFITAFNEATGKGLQQLDEVIARNPYDIFDLRKYYTKHISYQLTAEKRKGLGLFLAKIQENSLA
ncbi:MAG: menaquinone biosynthesis protein [Bacteroidetes bacterium]|nr:menaquinone biosynthesis protein [Bacteroidota bacterium]